MKTAFGRNQSLRRPVARCCAFAAAVTVLCIVANCVSKNNLVPTPLWGGFTKNVRLSVIGAQPATFPAARADASNFSGWVGEPPKIGWENSISLGAWDSIGFEYAYNDSLPDSGQTRACTMETARSAKDSNFFYTNIAIYKWNSAGLTDYFNAPDSKLLLTGIGFDDSMPLTAADNGEPVTKSEITARHALRFLLTWSGDSLSGEFHWANIVVLRGPPPLLLGKR